MEKENRVGEDGQQEQGGGQRRSDKLPAENNNNPPPPAQKCPRCDSQNTKFCYFNNYSLSQPRYFCKTCRRYWTQGGTLRNVPVGGGVRKGKRLKITTSATATSASTSGNGGEISSRSPLPNPPSLLLLPHQQQLLQSPVGIEPRQMMTAALAQSISAGLTGSTGTDHRSLGNLPWASHALQPTTSLFPSTGFFSSLSPTMQSNLINPPALGLGAGNNNEASSSAAGPIFRGFNFPPPSMNQSAGLFQGMVINQERNGEIFNNYPPEQNFLGQQPARSSLMNSWMINDGGDNNTNPNFSSFWNNNSGRGRDEGASSMAGNSGSNPNQWPNDLSGFNADSP